VPELHERVGRLEERMADLERDVEGLMAEITTGVGIAPRRPLRSRVHDLETTDRAAELVKTELAALQAAQHAKRSDRAVLIGLALTAANVLVGVLLYAVPHL
jgi:hypothetical protein